MADSKNKPLAVQELAFLQSYITNKNELIERFNIKTDSDWKDFFSTKLDLSKGSYAYNHKVKAVYLPKKNAYVLIDWQLADAVEQLNELGLTTFACCSGHFKNEGGYISFSTNNENVTRFLNYLCASLWRYKFYVMREGSTIVRWKKETAQETYSTNHQTKLMKAFATAINNYKND